MRKKKIVVMVMVIAMMILLFAGCSKSDETTEGEKEANKTTTETSSNQTTDDSKKSEEPITLSFLYWADEAQKELVEAAVATYEEKNPHLKIEAEAVPATGEFNAILESRMASEDLPDVSYMGEGDIVKYNEKGILADISSIFEGENAPKKLEAITIRDTNGKVIGVGLSNQLEILYYNKKMFDEAGIPYPPTKVEDAWTWDYFVEVAKKLTKDVNGKNATEEGFDPNKIETYGVGLSATMAFHHFWALYSNGGGVVSADGKEFLWDKPESVEAFQAYVDLINVHKVANPSTHTWWTGIGDVTTVDRGGAAMLINGSWDLANIPKCSDPDNIGVAVLPKFKRAVTMNCGAPMVVYNTSKHLDEAMKFAAYMLDPSNNLPLLQSGAWLPNELSWYTDEEKINLWTSKLPKDAVEVIMSYTNTPGAIVQWPAYYVPAYSKMDAYLAGSKIDKVYAGEMSVQELFDEIMPELKKMFESGTVE